MGTRTQREDALKPDARKDSAARLRAFREDRIQRTEGFARLPSLRQRHDHRFPAGSRVSCRRHAAMVAAGETSRLPLRCYQ
jgi:hypothetical protein